MTQVLEEEPYLKLNPAEIKQMSEVLSEALIQSPEAIIDYEVFGGIIYYESYAENLDLDVLASSTAGVLDPLGQLRDWLVSQFETVRNLIISGITSWIDLWIKPTLDSIRWFVSDIWNMVVGIGTVVYNTIVEQIPIIASEVANRIEAVVLDPVRSFIDWVSTVFYGLRPIVDTILSWIDVVKTELARIPDAIMATIADLTSRAVVIIGDLITGLSAIVSTIADAISNTLTGLLTGLSATVSSIVNAIISALMGIPATISVVIDGIISTIMAIPQAISPVINAIISALLAIPETIGDIVTAIIEALTKIPETIDIVVNGIVNAIIRIPGEIERSVSMIVEAITAMIDPIAEALGKITVKIPDIFAGIEGAIVGLGRIGEAISLFIDMLIRLPEKAPEIYSTIVTLVWTNLVDPMFKTIHETIIMPFAKGIDEIVGKISAGFAELSKTTMGFINAILLFPQWFPVWFEKHLVKPFIELITVEILPGGKSIYIPVFGMWISRAIPIVPLIDTLTKPREWTEATLIPALEGVFSAIWSGIQWLWKGSVEFAKIAIEGTWEALKDVSKPLAETMVKLLESLWDTLKDVGGSVQKLVTPIYQEVYATLSDTATATLKELFSPGSPEVAIVVPKYLEIKEVHEKLGSAIGATVTILSFPFWGTFPIRAVAWALRGAGRKIGEMIETGRIVARPLGVGLLAGFNPWRALASSLYEMAERIEHGIDTISTGLTYGLAIWFSMPIARVLNYWLRDFIPVQIPQEPQILEFSRRTLEYKYEFDAEGRLVRAEPTPFFVRTLDFAKYYASLMGYPEETLRWFFSYEKEDWIQVKDRFENIRNLPVSVMHELPTPSDMARMMVRDMFGPPVFPLPSFERAIAMRGMTRDTAHMYYMLHFRYPPPERLWDFTVRGISGLLWATLPAEEKEEIKPEIEALRAHMPVPPTELNFKPDQLLRAFKMYMKWHDMARFSWIKDFTSDNLIRIDTLADIPTKIDQRWMIKWGLYELLSEKNVKLTSPISEFRTKIVEAEAKSEVKMDLTNFCRTLQATGLHPDWIPVTAVAEAMNALTEERTLMRTGFINLFKEGFWGLNALETLLKGFVMASFAVGHFDMAELSWKTGWVNQPVMFLPAERRLLELRALMDRALDILRDMARDVARGYSEWIVADYEEYKDRLTKVIEHINKFFTEDYKKITGVELPEGLKLSFIEAYYKPYVDGLGIYRDVFTVRRVRYWSARWLGYMMYRVATGVVAKEDIEKLATYVSERAKLTPYEKEFIQGIMELMLGIAVRDYIPTPAQLATLSEYMVIPQDLITQAFEERYVPEKWRGVWKSYINIRPVADDVKALLTAWRRALRYGVIPIELEEQVKEYARRINFTEEEWKILELRAKLEEMVGFRREYVPPLGTLATWAEYMVIPEELIGRVFEVRMVAKEWQTYWKKYINIRPVVDDVRGLLTSYRRALLYVEIPGYIKEKVARYANLIGFTEREWDILHLRVQLEELVSDARTSITLYAPTPTMLATLSEYITLPMELIDKALRTRGVPAEWINIWKQYISVRPIKADAGRLLSAYVRALRYGAVPKEKVDEFIEELPAYGFIPREIDFITKRVDLEEAIVEIREQKAEYIPTPSMLATIVEYIPKAREFYPQVVTARRIPVEWQPIWAEYIDLRPIISEVRRYVSRAEDLYTYFAITEEAYKAVLEGIKEFGYTDREIELMLTSAGFERYLRAWRELVGDPDRLTTLAEYSPKARELAIGQLEKMIDALPIEEDKKAFIKQMWTEFIRIRPVYDEVRRYITELMSDFVEGIITEEEYVKELEALKEWGLDDYEIMFYKAIGGMRRARYLARRRGS